MSRPRPSVPAAGRRRRRAPVLVAALAVVVGATVLAPAAGAADDPVDTTTTTASTTTTTTTPSATTTTTTGPDAPGPDGEPAAPDPVSPPITLPAGDVDALRSLSSQYELAGEEELALYERYLAVADRALALDGRVRELNVRLAAAYTTQVLATSRLAEAEARSQDLIGQANRATEELEREEERLRRQAVQSYMGGELNSAEAPVEAVARSGSMNQLGTTLVYAGAVVSDRREVIRRVTELQGRLDQLAAEADAAVDEARQRRDEVVAAQDQLAAERDESVRLQLAVLDQAAVDQELLQEVAEKRGSYLEKIAALARVSDSISGTLADRQQGQGLPLVTAGIFVSPIPNPRFNSPFGLRVDPVFGSAAMHNGVDMHGQTGTPIRASADGVVVFAGVQGGYGICTVIDHGSGLGTLYGHQSKLMVVPGQTVTRGQVIGLVGSTGKSTGPHLHWEVRVFGQPVDPMPFIGPG